MANGQINVAKGLTRMVKAMAEKKIAEVKAPKAKTMEATNSKKAQEVMADGARGLPGVKASNKAVKMTARAQGAFSRAHTASAAATSPDGKPEMVGSQ